MAMIAPVPSFLWPAFCFPGTIGEGEGGELVEQSVKGGPHKKEFPTNEEIGNFLIEYGIEPLNML